MKKYLSVTILVIAYGLILVTLVIFAAANATAIELSDLNGNIIGYYSFDQADACGMECQTDLSSHARHASYYNPNTTIIQYWDVAKLGVIGNLSVGGATLTWNGTHAVLRC